MQSLNPHPPRFHPDNARDKILLESALTAKAGHHQFGKPPAKARILRDAPVRTVPVSNDAGESVMLKTRCIEAIHDIEPGKNIQPFLYWQIEKKHQCATKLIKRYDDLLEMSKAYPSKHDMAKKWAGIFRRKVHSLILM
jgi:hypothetical protein